MNHIKYWGKRLRLLGDVISGAIATIATAFSGITSGSLVIENFGLTVVGLVVALLVWLTASFISGEMDGGGD